MSPSKHRPGGLPRWLAWTLAGIAALVGVWALFLRDGPGGPPLDEIDPESQQRLEEVLREAGREDAAAR